MRKYRLNFIESLFLVITLVVVTFSATYAYFAAIINSAETSANISGNAADISLTFATSSTNASIVAEKILPGWEDVKEFTITGTNKSKDKNLYYDIMMVVLENDFAEGELKYSLVGSGTGAVASVSDTNIVKNPTNGKFTLFTSGKAYFPINTSEGVHSYSLIVKYVDTDYPQYIENYRFNAYITIESGTQLSRDERYNAS